MLFDDFAGYGAEIMLSGDIVKLHGSRQEAQFFAALDGLGAAGGSELVEGAGTVGLDGIFGDEKLGGDLAIAEAAGDQGEDFEFASGDAEGLLLGRVGNEGFAGGGVIRSFVSN